MNFVGIPCRHIIHIAVQLNLESLPTSLFLNRWCKDPNKNTLVHNNRCASNAREENPQTEFDPQNNEEYQLFLLNQTFRKIEHYARLQPDVINFFNTKLEEILQNARLVVQIHFLKYITHLLLKQRPSMKTCYNAKAGRD